MGASNQPRGSDQDLASPIGRHPAPNKPATFPVGCLYPRAHQPVAQITRRTQRRDAQHSDGSSAGDELVDDHDQRDHQKQVDQPAADMERQKTESPEDEEDDCDGPKHLAAFLLSRPRAAPVVASSVLPTKWQLTWGHPSS